MTFKHIAVLAAGFGLLMACEDAPKDDVIDDTALDTNGGGPTFLEGDQFITAVTAICNSPSAFTFEVETDYWQYGAVLNIFDTSFDPSWDEEHVLDPIEHADNGEWDIWGINLSDEATLAGQTPGVNTIFNCDNAGFLTYAIEVENELGQVTDCAVFGDDPGAIINGTWPGSAENGTGTVIGARYQDCFNFNP
jgi:hypothetical protein